MQQLTQIKNEKNLFFLLIFFLQCVMLIKQKYKRNAKKRNSTVGSAFRKLLGDAKQWKRRQELALEQLLEIQRTHHQDGKTILSVLESRCRRSPTVTGEGYEA